MILRAIFKLLKLDKAQREEVKLFIKAGFFVGMISLLLYCLWMLGLQGFEVFDGWLDAKLKILGEW